MLKLAPVPSTIGDLHDLGSKFPEALSVAICLNDTALMRQDINASGNPVMKKQLAYLPDQDCLPISTRLMLTLLAHLSICSLILVFVHDKLMVEVKEGNGWVYKNKDRGATASLRLRLLWDTDAGAFFTTGLLNAGVRTETDAALVLLAEHVDNQSDPLKTAAITGLGVAYVGSHRKDLITLLLPAVADDSVLALGFVFVGSGKGEITGTILQTLMERDDKALDERCFELGDMLSRSRRLAGYFGCHARNVEGYSAPNFKAGTDYCEEVVSNRPTNEYHSQMHYREPIIRKSVSSLGLISASNPQLPILDTLSKYSHDHDLAVALNAIFAMGLVGANMNNARLARILRQLAGYYYK
ncbi:hypothetical protein BDR03DRAFT_1045606 [Suillus americanus]|nr:hypothetical protein BDR03DRAFT_1045606 [Suillus americanus]